MFNVCCRKYSLLFSLVNRNSFELKFAEKITTTVSFALHFFFLLSKIQHSCIWNISEILLKENFHAKLSLY